MLKRIRDFAPEIEIDVVASNEIRDLTRREADIAIRHVRPEQPDLIAKLVRESSCRLYAAEEYLNRYGRPKTASDLADADFIGFEDAERMISFLNELGLPLTRRNFKLSSASGTVILELVRQGLGISAFVEETAALVPNFELVLPAFDPIPVPIWLVTHRELHTSRRVRLVFDLLAEALA